MDDVENCDWCKAYVACSQKVNKSKRLRLYSVYRLIMWSHLELELISMKLEFQRFEF